MKKFILSFLFFVALGLSYSFVNITNFDRPAIKVNIENVSCKYGQCKAIAKSTGNRCKHCVSNSGDSYCWQH